jgi:hypothetical protein
LEAQIQYSTENSEKPRWRMAPLIAVWIQYSTENSEKPRPPFLSH